MISLICPTRHRPESLRRLWVSAMETADEPSSVEIVAVVDTDDRSYDGLLLPRLRYERVLRTPFRSNYWNLGLAKSSGPIYGLMGDDIAFRTQGWDTRIEFAFPADGIALVHGRDGNFRDFGTHPFVREEWVNALGGFTPPYFAGDYADTWLHEVAEMAGRRVAVDILTEHLHPSFGKAAWDEVHAERLAAIEAQNPKALFDSLLPEREAEAARLLAWLAD